MSLYGTKARSTAPGPKQVWPFYSLSISCIAFALFVCIIFWPKDIPARDELIMTGGEMRRFMIRDDISNTGAGAMLPIFTSVYMRFRDIEGEFRYPWTFPMFGKVRNDTAVYVDIWVEKAAIGRDDAPLIWGMVEKNHYKDEDRQTIIRYEDLVEGQKQNGLIVMKSSITLIAAAIVFWLSGIAVGRWNRKKFPDHYS